METVRRGFLDRPGLRGLKESKAHKVIPDPKALRVRKVIRDLKAVRVCKVTLVRRGSPGPRAILACKAILVRRVTLVRKVIRGLRAAASHGPMPTVR